MLAPLSLAAWLAALIGLQGPGPIAVSRLVVQTTFFSGETAALGVLAGATLGLLASALSVGRQLRRVGGDRRRWR